MDHDFDHLEGLEDEDAAPSPEDLRHAFAPPAAAPSYLVEEQEDHRSPPHDGDAELAVLGGALLHQDLLPEVGRFLSAAHFFNGVHGSGYRLLLEAHERGEDLDVLGFRTALEVAGVVPTRQLASELIVRAMDLGVSFGDDLRAARRVAELSQRRNLLEAGGRLIDAARHEGPIPETIQATTEALEAVAREASPTGSWHVYSAADLLSAKVTRPEALLGDHVLDEGGLSFIVSEEGMGKSYLLLALALGMARGGDQRWLDLTLNPKPRRVLLLWGEGGDGGAQDRLAKILKDSPPPENLTVAVPRSFSPDISDPSAVAELRGLIEATRADFVSIDTFAEFTGGLDDSDNSQCKVFVRNINALRRATGAHFQVLHHTRKGGAFSQKGSAREMRGGTVLPGAADAVLVLDKEDDQRIRASWGKLRNAAPISPKLIQFDPSVFLFEVVTTLRAGHHASTREKILQALIDGSGEWMLYEGLEKATGLRRRALESHVKSLIQQGEVEKKGGLGRGDPAWFRRPLP